jgi:hypothetical protein
MVDAETRNNGVHRLLWRVGVARGVQYTNPSVIERNAFDKEPNNFSGVDVERQEKAQEG